MGASHPALLLDAFQVRVRDQGCIRNKAVYLALRITLGGTKELLGLWLSQTEGASFWLQVLLEPKNRRVQDMLLACADGLTHFPEATATVYPHIQVRRRMLHLARHSPKLAG